METDLNQFTETSSDEAFALQNAKLLKVSLRQVTLQAKLGAMVAYQGDVKFEHAGSGGVSKFIKKAMTGEGAPLMKIDGQGEVFLANLAEDVHLIHLDNEKMTCNGKNLLAFDAGISWDIERIKSGVAGTMAGGLYNLALQGTGWVAVTTDGPPVKLDVGSAPTFADAQAAVAWSGGVTTSMKTDVKVFKSLTGRGSGESLQLGFGGQGWVLVQPSEGQQLGAQSGGGNGGGISGLLGG